MNYVLENEFLRVEINPLGAEVSSIKSKKSGIEYLWQGDTEFWKNRATLIFPICGRLFDGYYTYKGNRYEMPLHGFAKISLFSVKEESDTHIDLVLNSNEETRAMYPFDFKLTISYDLEGYTLRTKFTVNNKSEELLPFSLGGHPGFNVPFNREESFEDYYIEFACEREVTRLEMVGGVFYSGKDAPYELEDGKIIKLSHELFDNDAIFLNNTCNTVYLKSRKNKNMLKMVYDDMKHLGFWHTPLKRAPFVCIEPWNGIPSYHGKVDDFSTKNEMIQLKKGKTYSTFFDLSVIEE